MLLVCLGMARLFLAGSLAWTASCITLTPQNAEELRKAAEESSFNPLACPGIDEEPTDTEKDFATDPVWKYFTYDTFDSRTWKVLDGLETCLRSVPGGTTNPWVGAADLWEAQELIYRQLGETAGPHIWRRQGWIEHDPIANNKTVLGLSATLSAPMSSIGAQSSLQQPCNALSNAAFFEVSLTACEMTLSDFGGSWPWRDEIIAAGALMAFGSFAMHGNPVYTTNADDPLNNVYDTGMMDRVSMDVLFFGFHQAAVRFMAVDPNDPNLGVILGVLQGSPDDPETRGLCQLTPGCTYGDAREAIRLYEQVLAGPPSGWGVVNDMRYSVPEYRIAAVAMTLMAIRGIVNDELFGAVAPEGFALVCSVIVDALVTPDSARVLAQSKYCNKEGNYSKAVNAVKWRVPKDIAKCMALFVEVLEALIEGMYWQETLVQPSGYLDPFLQNQVVNVTGCWRQTHGNWHRVAAQMMKKLMTFFGRIDELTEPSLSEEQKQAAWDGFQKVPASFVAFMNSMKTMKGADKVNLCRVFKLAKDVAASGQPMNWQVMPMLDAAGVNTMIMDLVQKNDPMVEPALPFSADVNDPTGICDYRLEDAKVDSVVGLAGLQLEDLVIDGSYDEQSTWEDTAIRMDVGMRTCPVNLKVKASADFKQDKGKWYDACLGVTWAVTTELEVTFRVASTVAWGKANFGRLFGGYDDSISAGLDTLDIEFTKVEITFLDISNFPGEDLIKSAVNGVMKSRLRDELEKILENRLKTIIRNSLSNAVSSVGSKITAVTGNSDSRRLSTFTCQAQSSSYMVSAAKDLLQTPMVLLLGVLAWSVH